MTAMRPTFLPKHQNVQGASSCVSLSLISRDAHTK